MLKRMLLLASLSFLLGTSVPAAMAVGQETPKPAAAAEATAQTKSQDVFRLDYVVREFEGNKQIASRSYTVSVKHGEWGRIRVGSRVPYMSSSEQVQYQDVGINIDCHPQPAGDGLLLGTNFQSSSMVAGSDARSQDAPGSTKPANIAAANPVFRNVSFQGEALVTIGKPTIISKLDDVATNRHYEIEVTATKIK